MRWMLGQASLPSWEPATGSCGRAASGAALERSLSQGPGTTAPPAPSVPGPAPGTGLGGTTKAAGSAAPASAAKDSLQSVCWRCASRPRCRPDAEQSEKAEPWEARKGSPAPASASGSGEPFLRVREGPCRAIVLREL